MEKQLKITHDGSATFYVPDLNEHYHSIHGALKESMHVFIGQGYLAFENNPVIVFELGLGTGLNALLTALEAEKNKKMTTYYALEKYPVESNFIEQLNYHEKVNHPDAREIFKQIHQAPWENFFEINSYFKLKKVQDDVKKMLPVLQANVIYFDAFAPEKQRDMWTADVFERMYQILLPGGILTTYCAKGVVRRTMEQVGFHVERLPGPPGKREMLKAKKTA